MMFESEIVAEYFVHVFKIKLNTVNLSLKWSNWKRNRFKFNRKKLLRRDTFSHIIAVIVMQQLLKFIHYANNRESSLFTDTRKIV
jgi:hypothetical protein